MFLNDVEYLVGRPVRILDSLPADAPQQWEGYVNSSKENLTKVVEGDIGVMSSLMPKTYSTLLKSVDEAFLVSDGNNVLRVLNQSMEDGSFYSWISNPPVMESYRYANPRFFRNAPKKFSDIYINNFNGLYDASRFGGPTSLSDMTSLANMIEDFSEHSWSWKLRSLTHPEDIVLIFSSGGGGYLFLDLRIDQRFTESPECMLIMNDPAEEPEFGIDFWEYLDAWSSIAMGE